MKKTVLWVTALLLFTANNFVLAQENPKDEIMINNISPLTLEQKRRLIEIAKNTIFDFVTSGKTYEVKETDPRLKEEEGTFVTIHKDGQLRGCIGNIIGRGPLYLLVRDMAIASASEDPRFKPVSVDELKSLEIEVSVLSKPRVTKDVSEIVMGKHGVIVGKGMFNQGVFLPQVATETGWSREEFLSQLCSQKAGLPRDCWQDPNVKIQIFEADVFSEKDL